MSEPLTPRQEHFCTLIVEGDDQTSAYRKAYRCAKAKPETVWSEASRLMIDPKVSARIEELREPVREKTRLTLESHLTKLAELRDSASERENYAAAITAEVSRGKAAGLYVEKSELTGKNGNPLFSTLTREQKTTRVLALLKKAKARADVA